MHAIFNMLIFKSIAQIAFPSNEIIPNKNV